jgi:tRNA pseudouridine13 synthase
MADHLNPLPQRYLTTTDRGIGGRIKIRPEDFLVDEIPLYEPSGQGEHLYLRIEKIDVGHVELMSLLRRRFSVPENAIGFAGMKDKIGVTRQTVSIRTRENPETMDLGHQRVRVLWAARHANKIRRGHLRGNRFSIRIREVDALKAPIVARQIRSLQSSGVPNYFDYQRFGYRRNNHLLGIAVLRGQWDRVLAELLGARGEPFPDYQRERRELFDAGRHAEAAAMWTPADRSEIIACRALANGADAREACARIGRTSLSFWVSAAQSAAFNGVLDRRLQAGTLLSLVPGDLAWKHDSRSVFKVDDEVLANPVTARRLAELEISPSGPLWGDGMTRAGGDVDQAEIAALAAMGLAPNELEGGAAQLEGARRPLRVPLVDPEIDSGIDEHGQYIRVAFDLPRGAYATIVLREIMKCDGMPVE